MALDEVLMGTEIKDELASVYTILDPATLKKFSDAIAKIVVKHIQDNAEVKTTVTGVTAGGATLADQPGTIT